LDKNIRIYKSIVSLRNRIWRFYSECDILLKSYLYLSIFFGVHDFFDDLDLLYEESSDDPIFDTLSTEVPSVGSADGSFPLFEVFEFGGPDSLEPPQSDSAAGLRTHLSLHGFLQVQNR
jgi:hypothetical protein